MRLILALLFFLLPVNAVAQGTASLVADNVTLTEDKRLIATGNVEAFYQDTTLRASRIIYDQATDTLQITGPIVIQTKDGTFLTAREADLDPQLQNGILRGARIVLNDQLQLASNQINQEGERFLQLYKTTASSCNVCGDKAPLWSIRSESVIHDRDEQQLYFENAIFLIKDIPVFWIPRIRLPDPTLERSAGFLIPEQIITSELGTGYKIPYFIPIGDHKDLTLTPYLSPETRTLELTYRQAFANGNLRATGAVSDDTLIDENRSYLFANGQFNYGDGYRLTFDIEVTSDDDYLDIYNFSGKDRLDSAVNLRRVTDTTLIDNTLTIYQSLREDEDDDSLPPVVADFVYEKRLQPRFGGTLTLGAGLDTTYRFSGEDGDIGRDVTRAGAFARWNHDWIFDPGVVATFTSGIRADAYNVQDDSDFEENDVRLVPEVAVTFRWPWATTTSTGASHLIEPIFQIAASEDFGGTPPNEDSTRNEFDQGNILTLSRFAGDDAVETGIRAAFGGTWTRAGTGGTFTTLGFGRVVRQDADENFSPSSGLDTERSDWLLAGQIQMANGFAFDARALFDDETEITRAAGLINWRDEKLSLSAAYIWQDADAEEDRLDTLSEWTVDAAYDIDDTWSVSGSARYDLAEDRPVRAALGVGWQNECVSIDLSASRRYTVSSTDSPTTSFGLSGTIRGFSAGRSVGGPSARCDHE